MMTNKFHYLLDRSPINCITNCPSRFNLQQKTFCVDHTNQILDKTSVNHRLDLSRSTSSDVADNPNNLLLLHLLRLWQNCYENLEQTGIQHELRVIDDTQLMLDAGLLQVLIAILPKAKEMQKKEIIWIISNITAGTPTQIQSVIDRGFIKYLISVINTESLLLQIEATWAVCNAINGGTVEQVVKFIGHHC